MPTYHTRPMPHGWSKPRDLAQLAQIHAKFEFEIPLGDLPGIPEEFSTTDEPVRVEMQFSRVKRLAMVHVKLSAVLRPVCQRCLGAMRLQVVGDSQLVVVDSEAAAAKLPPELESFLAEEGRSSLADLAAEELLLTLPIVPQHAAGERCEVAAAVADGAKSGSAPLVLSTPEETQRPFADLRALLERDKN